MADLARQQTNLQDRFARTFPYLRLSLTDVCNFRCTYCLPDGYRKTGESKFLTIREIGNLVDAFAGLGVEKIRLTGGEPSVRKDFTDIARRVAEHPKIKTVAFTTNGYRLRDHARRWRDAGLTHINVSLDSLDSDRFRTITGHDRLTEVLEGITAAKAAGFEQVKVNTVLLRGINDDEISDFIEFVRSRAVSIRFIELMRTGDNRDYFNTYHLSSESIRNLLLSTGWTRRPRSYADGPAEEYSHPDYAGRIGIIAPYSKDFCQNCNRLRVTASGDLRLCLFGNLGVPLRALLQSPAQKPELKSVISRQLAFKESSHFLGDGLTGLTPHLASIGG